MATNKGIGVVWGVSGVTFTGLGSTYKNQSMDLDRKSNRAEILDGNGDLAGQVFFDKRITLSLNVVPSAASLADAKTSMDACVPIAGTEVTVADTDSTITDASHTGKYSVISARLRRSNTGPASIDMELEQSETNQATAAIS